MMHQANFENIYEKYSPLLYGIALELSGNKFKAEQIIIDTFKKIYDQNITLEKNPTYCIIFIRLVIKTAQEIFPSEIQNNFTIKQFENMPLLNQLICDHSVLQEFCNKKNIDKAKGLEIVADEFRLIRKFYDKN